MSDAIEDQIALVFAMFDWNGDGGLSRPEFHAIVSASSLDLPDAELARLVDDLFAEADLNDDGTIDFDEFRVAARKHPGLLDAV